MAAPTLIMLAVSFAWSSSSRLELPGLPHRASKVVALAKKKTKVAPPPPPETFGELQAAPSLIEALEAMGCVRPMESQYLAWPKLRETNADVALIAEAGSGKTLAYLVPLIDQMLSPPPGASALRHRLHVIVPTHDLASQVLRVATELCALTPIQVASAEANVADVGPAQVQVVIGTPAASASLLCGPRGATRGDKKGSASRGKAGPRGRGGRGRGQGRGAASSSAAAAAGGGVDRNGDDDSTGGSPGSRPLQLTVVFDEADFMLAGVRASGGKSAGAAAASPALQILDSLRRSGKATTKKHGGAKGAGNSAAGTAMVSPSAQAATGDGASSGTAAATDTSVDVPPSSRPVPTAKKPPGPWPRVIFVSATVPGQGPSSVGAFLDNRFPNMLWVRSAGAHRPVTSLASEFEEIDSQSEREAALLRLCESRPGRTLVFANSASRAEEAHRILQRHHLVAGDSFPFHPNIPAAQRELTLRRFAKTPDGLLVCSGLAARGIDLPDVARVVEYQMAPNIVEHVHRVGRTARAGKPGEAVSLVNTANGNEAELVKEVQRCRAGGWKYL